MRVSVLPRMLEVVGSAVEFEDVDGMTMLGVRPFGLPRSSRLLKRAFDLVVDVDRAGRGRARSSRRSRSPIRLDIEGPDLLPPGPRRPRRAPLPDLQVPLDGRRRRGAEGPPARPQRGRRRACSRSRHDPRVTRVGALLRTTSLDELPQLFNVAARRDEPRRPAPARHRRGRTGARASTAAGCTSRPGMTGPWQVLGAACRCRRWSGSTTSTSRAGRSGWTSSCWCAPCATCSRSGNV